MKKHHALVSIIVPVYNCEAYIEECIKSLLDQTYSNIEVILIDDGSKDASLKLCKKYEDLDSRVQVISQENLGVSNARNRGIREARGRYLSFVDADDYVEKEFIESLVAVMPAEGLGVCGYKRLVDGEIRREYVIKEKLDIPSLYRYIFARNEISMSCCNKLFSAEILQKYDLAFNDELHMYEDGIFLAEYLKYVNNRFGYVAKPLYVYRKNEKSAMQSTYLNRSLDVKKVTSLEAVDKLNALYDHPELHIRNCFAYRSVRSSLWLLFQMISSNEYEVKYADQIKANIRRNIKMYLQYREGSCLEHIMVCLICVSPYCVFILGTVSLKVAPKFASKYLA